jgi:hypothetical protein
MPYLTYSSALELKKALEGTRAEVLTPDSDDFADSIIRWSETCEKEAVGAPLIPSSCVSMMSDSNPTTGSSGACNVLG